MSIKEKVNMEDQILQSATKLFLERGFKGTSTTEIALDAGCNQALVHYYYRSKDKLFDAIFQAKFKLFFSKFMEIEQEEISFEEKISRFIKAHFQILEENPQLPNLLFTELNSNPKRFSMLKERIKTLPTEALKQLDAQLQIEVRFGRVRPMNVMDLLLTIISLNISVFIVKPLFQILANLDDLQYQALIAKRKNEHVEIVLRALKPITI